MDRPKFCSGKLRFFYQPFDSFDECIWFFVLRCQTDARAPDQNVANDFEGAIAEEFGSVNLAEMPGRDNADDDDNAFDANLQIPGQNMEDDDAVYGGSQMLNEKGDAGSIDIGGVAAQLAIKGS